MKQERCPWASGVRDMRDMRCPWMCGMRDMPDMRCPWGTQSVSPRDTEYPAYPAFHASRDTAYPAFHAHRTPGDPARDTVLVSACFTCFILTLKQNKLAGGSLFVVCSSGSQPYNRFPTTGYRSLTTGHRPLFHCFLALFVVQTNFK